MYYEVLAGELLNIKTKLLQVPADQKLSKMIRGELFALNYLNSHTKAIHPKELSEQLFVSTARIARLLNHLEEKKLIVRLPDPEDNRQILVELTEEGRKKIQIYRKEVIFQLTDMLEALGPEDSRDYIRILEKIYHNFIEQTTGDDKTE